MKKKLLIVLLVILLIVIVIGMMYLIDRKRMKDNKPVIFSTWGYCYAPPVMAQEYNYSKTIGNTLIELDVPSEWTFEEDIASNEDNNFYKFALKIYKDSPNKYITLYYYNGPFGVCGTGRTDKEIKLNNEQSASIGYYDNNEEWSDISFYEINRNIAFLNYGLEGNDAKEAIEIAKTINITKIGEEVFEEPQTITYEVKGKEQYKLTKEDEEFNTILEKLNSSLIEGYTSREGAYEKGYYVGLEIIDIEKEIYSENSVLRLHYSDTYEINIIFEENSVLDIIYIEEGRTYCFYGFDNKVQEEIKDYVDNIKAK